MRILQLTGYFYPEKAASIYLEEIRFQAFADAGFDMVVFGPTPTRGITEEEYQEYRKRTFEKMYDEKLEVHRFKMFREGKNPLMRVLRYFLVSMLQFYYGVRAKNVDMIYVASTPPTQGALAALVKKIKHKPFVYNLQDIFPDSLVGTGLAKKGGLLWKIGRVIENFTYRNADKIIVISEDFKRNIMAKGVPEEKIVVVYNWVDEEAVVDVPREENKLFDKYGLDRDKFYVTYNGNIGLTQNMDMLLEVAKELQQSCGSSSPMGVQGAEARSMQQGCGSNNPADGSEAALQRLRNVENGSEAALKPLRTVEKGSSPVDVQGGREIHFVLVGEGAYKAEVEKRIKEQGITNVTLLPFQPYEDISHVFSLGDVSLVISKPGVGANSVPSKTWSIMSASRPVLASFDENELKTIIENNHCGIFTKAGDKEAFKEAILKLYHNPELCKEYGCNGRQFVMENLTKEVGTRKYVDVIKQFASKS